MNEPTPIEHMQHPEGRVPYAPEVPTLPPSDPDATQPPPPADAGEHADALIEAADLTVPGYEILSELGRGGMGVVYKAKQKGLNRLVALKMILAGEFAGRDALARFKAEAESVAKLQHHGIVQIHEIGEHKGLPYFSLEYVDGGSLDRLLNGTPLPPREAATLVEKLARAVQAAHDAGIIHRDLKPANVLLSGGRRPPESSPPTVSGGSRPPLSDVTPKITDFGLAKQLDVDSGQTKSGAILGTPSYMAPEQAAGKTKAIGPATDVYALGAILYECLTGRPPFPAATPLDTIIQVVGEEPVPVSRLQTRTPIDLETITLKCLSKKPERRYGTSSALADDLRRFLESRPVVASRPSFLTQVRYWMRRPERVRDAGVLLLIIMLLQVPGVLNSLLLITGSEVRGIDRSLFCFTLPFMLFSVCVGYQTIRAKRWAIWAGLISRLILLPSLPLSILLPRWTGPGSINHELTIHEYGYMIQGVGYMFIPLCAYCLALYAYYSNREYFMDAGRSSGSPSPGLR